MASCTNQERPDGLVLEHGPLRSKLHQAAIGMRVDLVDEVGGEIGEFRSVGPDEGDTILLQGREDVLDEFGPEDGVEHAPETERRA